MNRNEYLEIVAAQVRCKRAVPYLKEELADHIEDQKEAYIANGMNPFEAEVAAVREMGDPVETGMQLDRVHKPKMEWKLVAGVCLMSIIGIWIQLLITKGCNPDDYFFWYVHVLRRQLNPRRRKTAASRQRSSRRREWHFPQNREGKTRPFP